ncbi:MAG: hypothetical protein LC136_01510, partial [Burkholderiales bacterium]|nr:hypothetical protein [Burkholderiales bacterium]
MAEFVQEGRQVGLLQQRDGQGRRVEGAPRRLLTLGDLLLQLLVHLVEQCLIPDDGVVGAATLAARAAIEVAVAG